MTQTSHIDEASAMIPPDSQPHISIVTPVYACASCLESLYERLRQTLEPISENFEIIMVNDASPDDAWERIGYLCGKDKRVKGLNLSRNFGQHNAITAGLDQVAGEWVVVMDCDLQDQPEEIPKLYSKAREGYDIVFGRRCERKDTPFKRLMSWAFYKIYDYFTEHSTDPSTANFGIFSLRVIEEIRRLREQNRNFPLFAKWLGFRSVTVDIDHSARQHGKSSYTFMKAFNLAIDSITSHSNKPLRLSIIVGFLMSALSLLYGAYLIIRYFAFDIPVEGWTSVMVSIYLIGGLIFANLGVMGLYIGKIFNETKNRPLYSIADRINT